MSRFLCLPWLALTAVAAAQTLTPANPPRDPTQAPPADWPAAEVRTEPPMTFAAPEGVFGEETVAQVGDGAPTNDLRWVDDKVVTDPARQSCRPAMAITPDGRMFLAVEDHGDHDGWVSIHQSLNGGDGWTWRISFRTGNGSRNPALAYAERASGEQWLHLVYEAYYGDDSKRIVAIRVDPRNLDWDPVILTDPIFAPSEIQPRVTTDNHSYDNYYVYVTFTQNFIDYNATMFTRSLDRGATFSAPANVTGGSENFAFTPHPDIAYGSGGLFIAFEKPGWTGTEWERQVWVTESENFGVTWSAPLQLTTSNEGTWDPRVAASTGAPDVVVIAYTQGYASDDDIHYAYSVGPGVGMNYVYNQTLPWTFDEEKTVALTASNAMGRFHATWWRNYDIMYSSTPVTPPFAWSPPVRVNEQNFASSFYSRPTICPDPMLPPAEEACIGWTDYRSGDYVVYFDAGFRTLGDMNCDGVVTVSDIAGFVLALTNPAEYAVQFPECDRMNADVSGDGVVTVSDIAFFVALLTGS